jgi:hypothetical protein
MLASASTCSPVLRRPEIGGDRSSLPRIRERRFPREPLSINVVDDVRAGAGRIRNRAATAALAECGAVVAGGPTPRRAERSPTPHDAPVVLYGLSRPLGVHLFLVSRRQRKRSTSNKIRVQRLINITQTASLPTTPTAFGCFRSPSPFHSVLRYLSPLSSLSSTIFISTERALTTRQPTSV